MTRRLGLLLLMLALATLSQDAKAWGTPASPAAQPDPRFFRYVADVMPPADSQQDYVNIPPEVWKQATSDLRDLRLYDGAAQVPYLLAPGSSEEVRGSQTSAVILNLGRIDGNTQFVLDMHQGDTRASYDSVRLTIRDNAPDFFASARVEGMNQLGGNAVELGTSTLFKLEKEKLGANLTLNFPPSVFRYLRVTIPSIDPHMITGAQIFSPGVTNFGWTAMDVPASQRTAGHDSVFEWDWTDTVPVGRIEFTTDTTKDFWRRVELQGEHDSAIVNGAIWSIHRADHSTNLELTIPTEAHSGHFKLIVHNGDDAPLKVAIRAAYRERRLYFTPVHQGTLQLYFGDADLEHPSYDYARTQPPSPEAKRAQLGEPRPNPSYTARPDRRPWTEKHPAVLWLALAVAVLGLGAVALRSMSRAGQAQPPTANSL